MIANHLLCGGQIEITPDHLRTYSLKLYDYVTSNYICTISFSISLADLPEMNSFFGNSSSELDVMIMSQNFRNFVSSIGPIVFLHKKIEEIYIWKSVPISLLSCFLIYLSCKINILIIGVMIGL